MVPADSGRTVYRSAGTLDNSGGFSKERAKAIKNVFVCLVYGIIVASSEEVFLMTQKAHQKRIAAVKVADALNAIEGVPVSANARQLSARWARGEISGEQMKSLLLSSHKKMAANQEHRAHG